MATWDVSLWDESLWDVDPNLAATVLAFSWDLQPLPEEGSEMPLSVRYSLTVQRVDPDNGIRNQLDGTADIPVPDNIFGDNTYAIPDGTVDMPISLIYSTVDIVSILTSQEIVVKFNDILGTTFTLRPGGSMLIDGKNITAIYISNASGNQAVVRVLQAVRQDLIP
jgi:hypothetical protein